MIKPERIESLLKEMAESTNGQIVCPTTIGDLGEDRHHIEILVDEGLADWIYPESGRSPSIARITSNGYKFLGFLSTEHRSNANSKMVEDFRSAIGVVAVGVAIAKIVASVFGLIN